MGTVSARDLLASLDKTRDMGLVEETFDICGHNMVVRNLRPTEVEAVLESCKGLEDLPYVNAYQREHVIRAIVELDGYDLREVEFIDDEEPDPKKPGQMRRVRVERHKWLSDKVVRTWGQEVIFIVYRKIGDCTTKADKVTQEGVIFMVPDEQPEATYRRILGELKEAEDNVPPTLIDKTLTEFGYIRKSTADELKAAEDRLAQLRVDEEAKEAAEAKAAEAASQPISPVAQAMANRKPLNQSEEVPPPERVVVTPAQAPRQVVPAQPQGAAVPSRASQLAALEADADLVGALDVAVAGPSGVLPRAGEVAELGGSSPRPDAALDARQAASIIDQPPPAGINPKFRPPQR